MKCKDKARDLIARIKQAYSDYEASEKAWIDKNFGLIVRFFQVAIETQDGNRYISQKAICEDLRNNTNARDTDRAFKINNDCVALMAHLFNDVSGTSRFRTKKRRKVVQ